MYRISGGHLRRSGVLADMVGWQKVSIDEGGESALLSRNKERLKEKV
jgi:hypothetical protein